MLFLIFIFYICVDLFWWIILVVVVIWLFLVEWIWLVFIFKFNGINLVVLIKLVDFNEYVVLFKVIEVLLCKYLNGCFILLVIGIEIIIKLFFWWFIDILNVFNKWVIFLFFYVYSIIVVIVLKIIKGIL